MKKDRIKKILLIKLLCFPHAKLHLRLRGGIGRRCADLIPASKLQCQIQVIIFVVLAIASGVSGSFP